MTSIDIPDAHHDRILALREELAISHATEYTSVTLSDVLAYLLDLADTVDDPDRQAEIDVVEDAGESQWFPRGELEAVLEERTRQHSDDASPMDLYSIAAEYDIAGRSNMTKDELITAILDTAERRYTDPFAPVDVDFPNTAHDELVDDDEESDTDEADAGDEGGDTEESDAKAGDAGHLNEMLDLLDTHSDKWGSSNGDARYEVELPDGSVESARTKDDVRALLFRHY